MPKQTKAGVSKAAAKANKETLLTEHNTSINNNNDEEDTESVHSQSTTNTNKRLRSSSSSNTTTTTNSPLKQMTNPNSNTSNKSKAKTSSSPPKLKAAAAASSSSSSSSSKEVKSYLKDLFATLKTYRCPTTSHCPSETFLRLPSSKSRANSHYYAQITRPIDMTQIEQKLNDNLYINVDDFDADFNLLITNAKTFYKTTTPSSSSSSSSSLEYKHAQMLADIFEVEKKKRFDIVAMLSLMDNKHDGDDNDNEAEEMDEENEETTTPTKRSSSRSATTTSTSSKVSPNAAAHSLVKSKLQTKLNATPPPSTATNLNTSIIASASADSAQLMASSFEEFFYTMASHKCPDTKRSLAIVFYMLPSNKV
jgi:hypothetical protein